MYVVFFEHGLYGIQTVLLDGMLFNTVNNLADVAHNGKGVQQRSVVIIDIHQLNLYSLVVAIHEIVHTDVLSDHVIFLAAEYLTGLLIDVLQMSILIKEQDTNYGCVEDRPVTQVAVFDKALLVAVARHILLGTDDDRRIAMFVA